ncbi:fimbrial protein [Leminorella grimontii]|uniref:fimbrial protein n=1 Tax=Leminorella grimontii TaxID=82981 RepID=UPI00321F98F7
MMNKTSMSGAWRHCLLSLLTVCSFYSRADTVTVNITGNVLASPCVVDVNDRSQTVDFGRVPAASLSPIGSAGLTKSFSIRLTDCPETTTSATMLISGKIDPNSAYLFGTSIDGDYGGFGIKVKPQEAGWSDNSVYPAGGATITKAISSDTHSVTFAFDSRLQSTTNSIFSGVFVSVMMVSFTYQ